jgi:hypothetical protein
MLGLVVEAVVVGGRTSEALIERNVMLMCEFLRQTRTDTSTATSPSSQLCHWKLYIPKYTLVKQASKLPVSIRPLAYTLIPRPQRLMIPIRRRNRKHSLHQSRPHQARPNLPLLAPVIFLTTPRHGSRGVPNLRNGRAHPPRSLALRPQARHGRLAAREQSLLL